MKKLYMLVAVMFLSACGGHSASDWVGEWGVIPEEGGAPVKKNGFIITPGDKGTLTEWTYFLVPEEAVRKQKIDICTMDNPEKSEVIVTCMSEPDVEMSFAIDGDVITIEGQSDTFGRMTPN